MITNVILQQKPWHRDAMKMDLEGFKYPAEKNLYCECPPTSVQCNGNSLH